MDKNIKLPTATSNKDINISNHIINEMVEMFEEVKKSGFDEIEKAPVLVALSQEIRILIFNPREIN